MAPRWSRHLWWILGLASLVSLAAWVLRSEPNLSQWEPVLLSIILITILIHFRFLLGEIEVNLSHAISLTLGVAVGAGAAGIALTVGFALGELIYGATRRIPQRRSEQEWRELEIRSLEYSRHALSLFGGLAIYQMLGGKPTVETNALPGALPSLGLAVGFTLIFLALHWMTRILLESRRPTRQETIILLLVAILPAPFSIVTATAYALIGLIVFIVLGGLVAIISLILRNLSRTEQDLSRRLQELSTLSHISQAMRTTLDVEALLTTIYLQVAHLLQVENFYVALINVDNDELSYPLAVKNRKRETWPTRPLANRLTERVIETAAPVLIPEYAPETLREMGLPELDNPPQAWLGVPLTNPDRTFGCLAVFHTEPDKRFTEKDRDLLVTLAGQAAVALDNALLYKQTFDRTQALTLLNEITASISSTLDPERALELVNHSMIRVGGGQKAAIFLLDPDRQQLFLARATNLTDDFIKLSLTIPVDDTERTAPTLEGVSVLIDDVSTSHYSEGYKELYKSEGIQAVAEFPLTTPQGTIGQVAVYFSNPRQFQTDQTELLKTFASQAALAVSNARVHAETDMALRRRIAQLSTLEAIGREMATTHDLNELCRTILDHALRFANVDIGYLVVHELEADGFRVAAQRGCAPSSRGFDTDRITPVDDSTVGKAFSTSVSQIIPDTTIEPDYVDWSNVGARSVISTPITRKNRSVGVITIESIVPGAFWSEHEQFLSQLAAQSAIALSNAFLYKELEDHLREQALLYRTGSEITATLEMDSVAQAVVENLVVALNADGADLYRRNETKGTLELLFAMEKAPRFNPSIPILSDEDVPPSLERCMEIDRSVQWTERTATDPKDKAYLTDLKQVSSLLAIPLTVGEETIGVIEVFTLEERIFEEREVRTARTIANQTAIALKNTDLFRQVQDSREGLLAVLNSTEEGMIMADAGGRIAIANNQLASITGFPLDMVIGKNLNELRSEIAPLLGYKPDELTERMQYLQDGRDFASTPSTYALEEPYHRYIERSEAPVKDSNGNIIGWLIVLRDVSREMELDDAKKQLTEMIVHDLRSPLTAILGSIKVMDGIGQQDDEIPVFNQAVLVARRSCDQMLGLVNALLDIAKLESGELQMERQTISFNDLSAELLTTNTHVANESGIILQCSVEDAIPEYYGDEDKIRRVLTNLLDNALKFTPPGGQVNCDVRMEDGVIRISVSDTGPGIPPEYREKIFDRFIQVPGTLGTRLGTGLGLAFAKLAIEAHGGSIWVEENPAGGSIFVIHLPLEEENENELPEA
ncbi:MAG: GAF domain-containing protein [Anaerolineales bacterium]|nr:GAF domain-containing protein [Anaerolineales bacterium]